MLKCVGVWGSAQNPDGGAHNASPDFLIGWGGGHPFPIPYPLSAFGISILSP